MSQKSVNLITYTIGTELLLKPLFEKGAVDYDTFYKIGNLFYEKIHMQKIGKVYQPIKEDKKKTFTAQYPGYVSMTEVARQFGPSPNQIISGWLNRNSTKEYLSLWRNTFQEEGVVTRRGHKGGGPLLHLKLFVFFF